MNGYEDVGASLLAAPAADESSGAAVAERARNVLRPSGALARMDEVASWLASWQRNTSPSVKRPAAIVFVGDHGIVEEGVSAYPAEVTAAMHDALERGAATAAVMARILGATLKVVDAGVGRPAKNFVREPALDEEAFASAFDLGRATVRALDADLLVLGEMGIGNTTAAATICACLYGMTAEDWTGRGTGIDDATLRRKTEVVRRARERVGDAHPLEVLRQVGGHELVALAGAAFEARLASLPLVLDGFVVTAALAPLEAISPGALDHCVAGHCSSEPGHRLLLDKLGKRPLLDLDLRLGEASGALAAVPLIALAAAAVVEVATFDEWGVSR